MERFEEAVHDSTAGLTYTALSGIRKQSIEDVERLFGEPLILWMKNKGYNAEADYLQVIHHWRRACDERGLSGGQCSKFNMDLLNYILDDLMPWHKVDGLRDFSLLEVNRYMFIIFSLILSSVKLMHFCYTNHWYMCLCTFRNVNGVRGFSRETLIALAANIESREWRREFNVKHNIPPEHPRGSTTDDVECFFSVLRNTVGKDFTLKEVW